MNCCGLTSNSDSPDSDGPDYDGPDSDGPDSDMEPNVIYHLL